MRQIKRNLRRGLSFFTIPIEPFLLIQRTVNNILDTRTLYPKCCLLYPIIKEREKAMAKSQLLYIEAEPTLEEKYNETQRIYDWVLGKFAKANNEESSVIMLHWGINDIKSTFTMIDNIKLYQILNPKFEKIVVICTNQPKALHTLQHYKIPIYKE